MNYFNRYFKFTYMGTLVPINNYKSCLAYLTLNAKET